MTHLNLKSWFFSNKREFPWRLNRSPYRVWVSEVMLQQTRAAVVVEYFNRWMKKFPKLEDLAKASEDEVIKQWEGLGYYSRARNLRLGAIYVVKNYSGVIPDQIEKLLKIKGLGSYTANAILSFAFQRRAPALDGNVMRVLSRLLAYEKEVTSSQKQLREKLFDFLPLSEPFIVMEALIELGAMVCKKDPNCQDCPLQKMCLAFQTNQVEKFPIKKKKPPITDLFRFVGCIECQGAYLLKKVQKGNIMEGLWEYPYVECTDDPIPSRYIKDLESALDLELKCISPLSKQKHHFTRFRTTLYPFLFSTKEKKPIEGFTWVSQNELTELSYPSGHRKITQNL